MKSVEGHTESTPPPAFTYVLRARVRPREIGYITALVDSYEIMGAVRTLDRAEGLIEVWVVRDFIELAREAFAYLEKELGLVVLDWGTPVHDWSKKVRQGELPPKYLDNTPVDT